MSVGDGTTNERNREIANDNYYSLKWLNAAVDEFLAKLDAERELRKPEQPARFAFDQVHLWTAEMRKLRLK